MTKKTNQPGAKDHPDRLPSERDPNGDAPMPTGQDHYRELGLKERSSPLVDKSDASSHQAEGPGGKGTGAGA